MRDNDSTDKELNARVLGPLARQWKTLITSSWTKTKLKVENVRLLTEVKTMLGKVRDMIERDLNDDGERKLKFDCGVAAGRVE